MLSLAGTAAVAGWTGWRIGTSDEAAASLAKISRTSTALGAEVRLTVFHRDRKTATRALEEAFTELDRVENILSLYRPESQICTLNRAGFLAQADPSFLEVLRTANRMSALTDGAFDITVQPLYRLHADRAGQGATPDQRDLEKTLSRIGWKRVNVSGSSIHLEGSGTEITLNGIAQGFAADAVGRVLREHGIAHAFIDTGEVGTVGSKVRDQEWTVGIRHPRDKAGLLTIARLNGRALATSGDYETRFGEDYRSHHLLDPRTGQSPTELASVSVVAPTAMEADALSTAVFLTGAEKGRRIIEAIADADALFVTKSGHLTRTAGFPAAT